MANIQSLPILLKELLLSAIAKEWEVLAQKAVSQEWEPELFLAELCELEANHRLPCSNINYSSCVIPRR